MNSEEVAQALQATFCVLQAMQSGEAKMQAGGEEAATPGPELSPAKSIQKNKITCLECGRDFRTLSPKHLKSHGLSGREYRVKWGLPLRQPLCAKSLSEQRRKAAKERGLPEKLRKVIAGRQKKAKAAAKKNATKQGS